MIKINTFRKNTFCITGTSGYIGSHLSSFLEKNGYATFRIGREVCNPSDTKNHALSWGSVQQLSVQLQKLKNPLLIHLGGHFVNQHSASDIDELIDSNVKFSTKIFEAFCLAGGRHIINIGSTWEFDNYGNNRPENLYAATKSANENILRWYCENYPLSVINLKLNDTYGGNDQRKKLLPLLKQSYQTQREFTINNGDVYYNVTHIDDVIRAILYATQEVANFRDHQVENYFVLSEQTLKIKEIVEILQKILNNNIKVSFKQNNENGSRRELWRFSKRLDNWRSQIPLEVGLKDYFDDK